MKQVCPIHKFLYEGNECPFCKKERLAKLSQKLKKTKSIIKNNDSLSQEDLSKLINKFNNQKF